MIANGLKNFELFHGAAILEKKRCVVILGDKKIQENRYLLPKPVVKLDQQLLIDLLLINANLEILTLGLPVRNKTALGTKLYRLNWTQKFIGRENSFDLCKSKKIENFKSWVNSKSYYTF